jgi:hypothetical protein
MGDPSEFHKIIEEVIVKVSETETTIEQVVVEITNSPVAKEA